MQIQGNRAIVAGDTSGMGRATAEVLARAGAELAVLDRPRAEADGAADEFGVAFVACDVTDFTGTEAAVEQAVSTQGGLDITVTTAGGGICKRTIGRDGPTTWRPSVPWLS